MVSGHFRPGIRAFRASGTLASGHPGTLATWHPGHLAPWHIWPKWAFLAKPVKYSLKVNVFGQFHANFRPFSGNFRLILLYFGCILAVFSSILAVFWLKTGIFRPPIKQFFRNGQLRTCTHAHVPMYTMRHVHHATCTHARVRHCAMYPPGMPARTPAVRGTNCWSRHAEMSSFGGPWADLGVSEHKCMPHGTSGRRPQIP